MSLIEREKTPHTVDLLDWLMLALAIASIGLLAYETWGPVTEAQRHAIIQADYIICGIFAVEFAYRWANDDRPKTFLWRNWYEVLGMIPVSEPAIRGFRLFRVIRIVILLGRFGYAADRALGDEFTYRLVNRFASALVDAIKTPITVAVLDEVAKVLKRGHYTRNIASALEENHDELRQMVLDKVRADPQTRRLAMLPGFEAAEATIVNIALRLVLEILADARTDELVSDILRDNLGQIREAVRQSGETASRNPRPA